MVFVEQLCSQALNPLPLLYSDDQMLIMIKKPAVTQEKDFNITFLYADTLWHHLLETLQKVNFVSQ